MKKIFSIFLIAAVCAALFSCAANGEGRSTDGQSKQTTETASKRLSEMGEMNFTVVSDKGENIIPYRYYYGGQLYGSGDELTYFGTGKILGFDIKTCIDSIPEMTVRDGFAVITDKNVDVFESISIFDCGGEKIYSGNCSTSNIRSASGGKDCVVSITVKRSGEGRYSDEYSMYLMLIKLKFE